MNIKILGLKRFYIWAWLLFPVLSVLTGVVIVLFRVAKFDPELSLIRQSLDALPQSAGISPVMIVALKIGDSIILAPLVNVIFAFMKSLAGAVFCYQKSMSLGERKVIIISNVIWVS